MHISICVSAESVRPKRRTPSLSEIVKERAQCVKGGFRAPHNVRPHDFDDLLDHLRHHRGDRRRNGKGYRRSFWTAAGIGSWFGSYEASNSLLLARAVDSFAHHCTNLLTGGNAGTPIGGSAGTGGNSPQAVAADGDNRQEYFLAVVAPAKALGATRNVSLPMRWRPNAFRRVAAYACQAVPYGLSTFAAAGAGSSRSLALVTGAGSF